MGKFIGGRLFHSLLRNHAGSTKEFAERIVAFKILRTKTNHFFVYLLIVNCKLPNAH